MEPWISISLLVLIVFFVVVIVTRLSKERGGWAPPSFDDSAKLYISVIGLLIAFMLGMFFLLSKP